MAELSEIDPLLLSQYINGFFGYGNYGGRWWFVGMEEGGGKTIDEIQRRLSIWCDRGKHELEDVAAYHLQLGEQQLFTDPVKSQPTWNKLIRIVLSAGGVPLDLEIVKAYQQDRFGRWNGDTCLMELLPLPSRSTGDWLYSNLSAVPHLTTREVYREKYAAKRAAHIRQQIAEHRPAGVVFYTVNTWYKQWWEQIAGRSFVAYEIDGQPYYTTADAHTRYFIIKHPVSHGVSVEYFHHIGQRLRI